MKWIVALSGYVGPALLVAAFGYWRFRAEWNWTTKGLLIAGGAISLFYFVTQLGRLRRSIRRRSTRYSSRLGLAAVFFLGTLALLNFLGYRHNKRWDLTENQQFSLAGQTINTVKGLQQDVQIIRFAKDSNPVFEDLVREYRNLSSRVSVQQVDPQRQPGMAQQFGVREFGEIYVKMGEKREKVSAVSEESLTNAVLKLTRTKKARICFSQGHQEKSPEDSDGRKGYSRAKARLQAVNYTVETIALAQDPEAPVTCDVVVVAGPKFPFLPTEVERLRRYLDAGGNLLALVDPETDANLSELLKTRGVQLQSVTVVDASGLGQIFGTGPAVPLVTDYESHPITRELGETMSFFPLARALKKVDVAGLTVSELFKTGRSSWGETELKPEGVRFEQGKDIQGPLVLGIASAKPRPTEAGDGSSSTKESRVVVIGDSDFAADGAFGQQRNGDVFANSVGWLVGDEDILSIAPKNSKQRMIHLTEAQAQVVRWVTIILLPAAALFIGMTVWTKRR